MSWYGDGVCALWNKDRICWRIPDAACRGEIPGNHIEGSKPAYERYRILYGVYKISAMYGCGHTGNMLWKTGPVYMGKIRVLIHCIHMDSAPPSDCLLYTDAGRSWIMTLPKYGMEKTRYRGILYLLKWKVYFHFEKAEKISGNYSYKTGELPLFCSFKWNLMLQ